MAQTKTTFIIRNLDRDYWQTVREFSLHRRISTRTVVLAAIDEYMARHKPKQPKEKKEVKTHDRHNNRPAQLAT